MDHIIEIVGHLLRDMLLLDGWKVEWELAGYVHMYKGDRLAPEKECGFTLNAVIPLKPLKAIVRNKAGWSVEQFSDFRRRALAKRTAAVSKIAVPTGTEPVAQPKNDRRSH